MSPREKHIPDDALRTTVSLTREDQGAVNYIKLIRRAKKDRRTTTNDILVDALWYFLEKTHNMTKDQIRVMVPTISNEQPTQSNVTEMPKLKGK
jgi:hypothetical protein